MKMRDMGFLRSKLAMQLLSERPAKRIFELVACLRMAGQEASQCG
jgi:hypothetical protein